MTASPASSDPAGRWSSRWHRATGLVLAGYLVVALVELALLRPSPSTFNRAVELRASLGLRLVAAVVLVSLVFHGLNGLRVVILEVGRHPDRWDEPTKRLVVFLTALSALPLTVIVLRPYAEGWWP